MALVAGVLVLALEEKEEPTEAAGEEGLLPGKPAMAPLPFFPLPLPPLPLTLPLPLPLTLPLSPPLALTLALLPLLTALLTTGVALKASFFDIGVEIGRDGGIYDF